MKELLSNADNLPKKEFTAQQLDDVPESLDARVQWPDCATIKEIRDRAGLTTPASMTVADILKDKAVEYLWEGQRRQDEIRLGVFDADPNRSVYPILESDRSANPKLEQNPGYSGK